MADFQPYFYTNYFLMWILWICVTVGLGMLRKYNNSLIYQTISVVLENENYFMSDQHGFEWTVDEDLQILRLNFYSEETCATRRNRKPRNNSIFDFAKSLIRGRSDTWRKLPIHQQLKDFCFQWNKISPITDT